MEARKITETIWQVGSEEMSGSGDCLIYAIGLKKGTICMIDTGTNYFSEVLENIQATPLKDQPISHIILTHCHYDHIGAVHQAKAKFPQAQIIAHSWDAQVITGTKGTENATAASWYGARYIPVRVDQVLGASNDMLTLGGTNLWYYHIPGHTPGSIAVVIQSEGKKVLFGQDVHGPFMPEFRSNIEDWSHSMKKLVSLETDVLCEGHFGIFEGKDKVKNFILGQLRQNGY